MNFRALVQQQHCAQIANPNVGKALLLAAHQFNAFHLAKMGGITKPKMLVFSPSISLHFAFHFYHSYIAIHALF
jgi:hypothetical protein